MFTLSDDKGAQDIVDLCKVNLSVHMYVQHPLSQLEYHDGPIEDETKNPEDVVILDEEDEIGKVYEEFVKGTFGIG